MEKLHDDHIHPHIEKTLLVRLYIFFFISIGIFIYIIREVIMGDIDALLAVFGICLGLVCGIVLGRFMGVVWHETKEKVVSRLDVVGALALATFIFLDIYREWIFGHWFHGATLTVLTLCFLSGAIFGRFLGMRTSVLQILKERNIAKEDPENIL